MFLSKERRRTLALYMLARIAQCLYNSLKQQGLFHFWGSDWAYGDALLFALSSAQVRPAVTCCCQSIDWGPGEAEGEGQVRKEGGLWVCGRPCHSHICLHRIEWVCLVTPQEQQHSYKTGMGIIDALTRDC